MSIIVAKHLSSYRDPSGFIFEKEGTIYRQVNKIFREHFDHFINSGCYRELTQKGLLVSHEVVHENFDDGEVRYCTLKPEKINFISYPYEWSFDMLKDAALLTLQLVRESIPFGIILKDATPYNIQWHEGRLIFIDTLSFEKYDETKPWIAYRQFCECLLGPLLLMHYNKLPLHELSLSYPDGIPLTVTKKLLPAKSRLSLHTFLHIFLHAGVSAKGQHTNKNESSFSKQKLLNLISSLETLVKKLNLPQQTSTWSGYYGEASQRINYLDEKKKIIGRWIERLPGCKTCADLGANEGAFSQLPAVLNIRTIAADFDPGCINSLYIQLKKSGEKNIQPLILDLANPSPATGFNNEERKSFLQRMDSELVLALALIHHLAIGKNVPLDMIANFFSRISQHLIIEFIPKEDEKIQLMLKSRKDIFDQYNEKNFEQYFTRLFTIESKEPIEGSGRILYFMKRR